MDETGNRCEFSPCRTWRYTLRHTWMNLFDEAERPIVWIGLNPSTADENQLDPTLRRVRGYSMAWGYNTFYMLNLFAFRATDPQEMRRAIDPVGPENDRWITELAAKSDHVMCAWGRHGMFLDRQRHVLELLDGLNLQCLEKTNDGIPKHPLYLKSTLRPIPV
ncbi:MAG: DUF1643 domain-containing protein [Kiritimatiellia bacterium]|jgi:hypothetical protein|uniref:DUF1643 domain-containing protein n=1 Tax=Atribacter sp. TaxID=2847780 RepID=UPI003D96485E